MVGKRQIYKARRKQRPFRITARIKAVLFISLAGLLLASCITYCGNQARERRNNDYRENRPEISCLLEVVIPDETPEIKLSYKGFDISFNPVMHQPNYGIWELTEEKADGTLPRVSKFRQDPDVLGCPTTDDYRKSGFDRGHMVPAGDMKWDSVAMNDSHYLTNISPQTHSLNGGRWSSLENKCREWVRHDSLLIIACGPILTDRMPRTIGESQIPVPERFFKIIFAPFAMPPRAIGFIMENGSPEEGLEAMAVTVDQIEEITGFDFFSCLPDNIENEIESQANFRQWRNRKK